MRVVLFGAGASHGSGSVVPKPPPLGAQLFEVLRRLYGSWRSIPEREAATFASDFEAGMALVIEKYGMAIAPLMQDMAVFLASFAIPPDGDNLYKSLLGSVDRTDVVWSTINYDCLLEFAVVRLGKGVSYFEEPAKAAPSHMAIWKLHGSCNFKVTGLEATRGVSFGTGVVFGGGIEPLDPGAVRAHYKGSTALYPAMALYAAGKPIAMSPAPIKDAQARWNERVLQADRVLTIGVRPNPNDTHIWGPLAQTEATLGYVGTEAFLTEWAKGHRGGRQVEHLGSTWTNAGDAVLRFINE